MALAFKDGLPGLNLPGVMQVAAGNFGKRASQDFIENIGPARHFPGVKLLREFLAPVPKMEGLFLHFPGGYRMGRDGESALGADCARELDCIPIRGNKFVGADS